ncbi:hypothetical protein TNCT_713831 [Trichonephila clavata]|uniref:Uncharacterized protein n=1 Tax=Trichonephila clavata TaxID=2740835 RepID=A0A8X6LNE0_TRICU|nr:hypothetical protein TNCT_713831 [Trichonephila clavata]
MITHDASCLRSGLSTKVRQICTLPVPCCSPIEATFSREGVFHTHNEHMWALSNPHSTLKQRFTVNVWVSIVRDSLLGPHILPP